MWIPAAGKSLWPLLRDGDSLRVRRVVSATELARGDVAVIKRPDGILAAHLVLTLEPLRTISTAGVEDPPPLEALGKVTGFRRWGRVWPWPDQLSFVLRFWPAAAEALKRVPLVRATVRSLRDR